MSHWPNDGSLERAICKILAQNAQKITTKCEDSFDITVAVMLQNKLTLHANFSILKLTEVKLTSWHQPNVS